MKRENENGAKTCQTILKTGFSAWDKELQIITPLQRK